ncbi:MAG: hypothetical protein WB297_02730, partial [Actinomycetota bacterium]
LSPVQSHRRQTAFFMSQLRRMNSERNDAAGLGTWELLSEASAVFEPPTQSAPTTGPATSTFAELLIDCEEDRTLRAVLVGMLRDSG